MGKVLFLCFMLITTGCLSFDMQWNHSFYDDDLTVQPDTNNNNNNNTLPPVGSMLFPPPVEIQQQQQQYNNNNGTDNQLQFFESFNQSEPVESGGSSSIITLIQWDFFSHMTITSAQCDQIANLVMMLNNALKRANPDVENITSTASRIGNSACIDNICPRCTPPPATTTHSSSNNNNNKRRRALMFPRRLLEVRTRSSSPELNPALRLPLLYVTSFHRKNSVHV
jgi:hypothetical protein